MLARGVGLVASPFKSFSPPLSLSLSLLPSRPPTLRHTHTRACKGVENVSKLAEKLANGGVWRGFELDMRPVRRL